MKRAVRTVFRLVAVALAFFGGLEIALEMARHFVQKVPFIWWHFAIGILLVGLGVFLFAASENLAEQLTDEVDDD